VTKRVFKATSVVQSPAVQEVRRRSACALQESKDRRIACVVPNWNGARHTAACLEALGRLSGPEFEVVVVDKGSSDDSLSVIRNSGTDVELIKNNCNLGFANASNVGIRAALSSGANYVWLLNNDAEPLEGALEAMIAVAESDALIGAVGSVLRSTEPPHRIQCWGGGQANLWCGYSSVARSPRSSSWFDYMCAGSMLVRREALLDVGLLDDGYFLYWEDADFGFRLRSKGWRLAVAPDSVVLHKENASTAGNAALRDRYSRASCLRFLKLWSPVPSLASIIFLGNRLAKRVLRGQFDRVGAVIDGIRDARVVAAGRP
jgi:GT2 family glycosyltransferase